MILSSTCALYMYMYLLYIHLYMYIVHVHTCIMHVHLLLGNYKWAKKLIQAIRVNFINIISFFL